MQEFWELFLWAAIPVALLIVGTVVAALWYAKRRGITADGPQERVERAYAQASAARAAAGARHSAGT